MKNFYRIFPSRRYLPRCKMSCLLCLISQFCLICLVCLPVTGCGNGSLSAPLAETEISFAFEPAAGTVVWWAADNTPKQRMLTDSEAGSGRVTLSLLKGNITPVLLYRDGILEPAGCIWPVSATMDEAGGFSARMLWRLLTETDSKKSSPEKIHAYCERFNWKRFYDEVCTIEQPWKLNQQKILKAIAEGTFTLKCLK